MKNDRIPGRASFISALALAFAGCSAAGSDGIDVVAPPELLSAVQSFVEHLGDERVRVYAEGVPIPPAAEAALRLTLAADLDCRECFRIEPGAPGFVIRGGGTLGAQYGLARALEDRGFRFFHPWRTHRPPRIGRALSPAVVGETQAPALAVRGIQMHTLHPIEALQAYWVPGAENLAAARRINDWLVKNRANYVQWVTLANVLADDDARAAWRAHTAAVLEDAHGRGLSAGVNVQLFASGNLQRAFDLVDAKAGDEAQVRQSVAQRLELLLGLPFDQICLSFGEFFGEEPQRFIDTVNMTYEEIQRQRPGLEVSAVIHVGDDPELRVEYGGEEMIYYFLVQHAHPAIVPWVHTVMYYNLFDDAGGAYHHEDFREHREFLLRRLRRGERVAYFPESAYWVAFDVSVPTYLPLYVLSRWRDVARLARPGSGAPSPGLAEHVIFSSGWEWGYWQNDYAVLRAGFRVPASWEEIIEEMFAPLGSPGRALAEQIIAAARDQHELLIRGRLAPYLAGEDAVIEMGARLGIVSQPARPGLVEVRGWDATARARFEAQVLGPLEELARRMQHARDRVAALEVPGPWGDEVNDGLEIDALRARFIHAVYAGALGASGGPAGESWIARAEAALEAAQQVVQRRHGRLYYPAAEQLTRGLTNPTVYQYGYLKMADDLCYWRRELAQLRNLVDGTSAPVPDCFLN